MTPDSPSIIGCDEEPIHIPGSIQPHGVLLALRPGTLQIEHAAGDTDAYFDTTPQDMLGSSIEIWFPERQRKRLRDCLQVLNHNTRPLPLFELTVGSAQRQVDAMVHESDGFIVIELEEASDTDRDDSLITLEMMDRELHDARTLPDLCRAIAGAVRMTTGFDRVMIYQFLPDGTGVVVAEALGCDIESFLGLRYPATDIPVQARALYLQNWLRLIPDVAYVPAPLRPELNPITAQPLDLSQSVLRSVSPRHLQYLANMGVAASMSISLIRRGELWGLIACHHLQPRRIQLRTRVVCELFAGMASFRLKAQMATDELDRKLASKQTLETLMVKLASEENLAIGLTRIRPNLLDLIPANAVTLWFGSEPTSIGLVPSVEDISALVNWLNMQEAGIFITDNLPSVYPAAAHFSHIACGVLAISLSKTPRDYVLWFLPELIHTVTWAGRHDTSGNAAEQVKSLTPRASFAAWQESVRLHSRPWQPVEIEAAKSLRTALLEIVLKRIDIIATEQVAARKHQDMLMAELDHRVKNMLATVQALASQSKTNTDTHATFLSTFDGRLQAMSKAHGLLTKSRWEGADLHTLIADEMAPFTAPPGSTVTITGSDNILLRPKAALALSLGLHELATNAAKYGALSVPGGHVHIDWQVKRTPRLMLLLHWRETGGPLVVEPREHGFGLTLIESSLSYELGGILRQDFSPEGVICTVEIPWDQIASSTPLVPDPASINRNRPMLTGLRILLVEDRGLVAMSITKVLKSFGGVVVGPAPRLTEAMRLAEDAQIDIAMLDVDLDGTKVWPAADVLARRRIVFFFCTGFDASMVMPARFADHLVLNKPFRSHELEKILLQCLALERSS